MAEASWPCRAAAVNTGSYLARAPTEWALGRAEAQAVGVRTGIYLPPHGERLADGHHPLWRVPAAAHRGVDRRGSLAHRSTRRAPAPRRGLREAMFVATAGETSPIHLTRGRRRCRRHPRPRWQMAAIPRHAAARTSRPARSDVRPAVARSAAGFITRPHPIRVSASRSRDADWV